MLGTSPVAGPKCCRLYWYIATCVVACSTLSAVEPTDAELARQVRSIFSNRCFTCHGPDKDERQAGFRLDDRQSAIGEAESGRRPIVPGKPESSELLVRLRTSNDDQRMPPVDVGSRLSDQEISAIESWITRQAPFQQHWSFVAPQRPNIPELQSSLEGNSIVGDLERRWWRHPIDRFVLKAQRTKQLGPSQRADRSTLLRRVSLDLTGLPPTINDIEAFSKDTSPDAYEKAVDRLLASPAYGEHWARKWLDLARYADSAGYADDPPRTIWAYRDWVVNAINDNLSFEQFTVEQLAGDQIPGATGNQLVATAFHRNTLTNNEGGTNDEEFRNVAIVDRVNTTMAVWMGITFNCAQCHNHKYDPFSQEEYFQVFDIFNQSRDADRKDESPIIELYTGEQETEKAFLERKTSELERQLVTVTPQVASELSLWEKSLTEPAWIQLQPTSFSAKTNSEATWTPSGQIKVQPLGNNIVTDTYTIDLEIPQSLDQQALRAIGLRSLPNADLPGGGAGFGGGNFVITGLKGAVVHRADNRRARYVRVELRGKDKILSLAEIEIFSGGKNLAVNGEATQSSTGYNGPAKLAIDGNTNGDFPKGSTTHTANDDPDAWWEVDLKAEQPIDRIVLWNRTDNNLQQRLDGAEVKLLDVQRQPIFSYRLASAPKKEQSIAVQPNTPFEFVEAYADYSQPGFSTKNLVIKGNVQGWAVGGQVDQVHMLVLKLDRLMQVKAGDKLRLEIEHNSTHRHHLLGSFELLASHDEFAIDWSMMSETLQRIVRLSSDKRTPQEQTQLEKFFAEFLAPSLKQVRQELKEIGVRLTTMKPATSVPVMRQVETSSLRKTFVQLRGNYKSLGNQVRAATPQILHPIDRYASVPDRLAFAKWLMDRENPLTARVLVNRYWEALFGLGLVRTSEEFGSQGDLPSHPELLDWLACEFMEIDWDVKRLLRLMVTSETYCQTSQVENAKLRLDLDNTWLARGPRVRLSAEMVRDQALAISGLLAHKFYGPPVKPPQPEMGLKAAFGSDTDWQASAGEDRYRRGLYTTWRRSNPYPSMATFDAPSREVCTLKRDSTNTPLQALVTLNDPSFVEAAQGLARKIVLHTPQATNDAERIKHAMLTCTARLPDAHELESLSRLLADSRQELAQTPEAANRLATEPIGPTPPGASAVELAAWTVVGNVLLNLDEILMKR